jgi:hypothetical protein
MNLEYINPKTIILELNKIIIHNKNAKDELNNLNINISWSAPEISDNRFWTGHETGNWPGIYTILINHFKNNIGSQSSKEIIDESYKVNELYNYCYNKYKSDGFTYP